MPNRDWAEMKPMLMQAWPSLPDEQLEATQGDREAVLELVTAQVGIEREDAEAELDALLGDEQ